MATVGRREDFDRVRPAKSELMKPMVEPPEVISVEMTPEEQDVYALMGVSPLVLTDRSVKNPKNAIVSVTLPGAVPNKPPFEQLEFEFEPTAPAQNAQERDYYPEISVVEPVFSDDDDEAQIYGESSIDQTDDFERMEEPSHVMDESYQTIELSEPIESYEPIELNKPIESYGPIELNEPIEVNEPISRSEPEEPAINRRRRRRSSAVLDE
jgi:ribonuclease E